MDAPIPEEFKSRPDDYEGILPIFVDADYYRDGELVHSTLRARVETPPEEEPGWTVQGRQGGQHAA